MSALLVLPDKVVKTATELIQKDTHFLTGEALRLLNSRQWEAALPCCLAVLMKTEILEMLDSIGKCCFQTVLEKSAAGQVDEDCEAYINAAVVSYSMLIDKGKGTHEAFAIRGFMYFLKAQINTELQLLNNAEEDCSKAITLGAPNQSTLEDQLVKIRYVRERLSPDAGADR